jgi:hypothetical protein
MAGTVNNYGTLAVDAVFANYGTVNDYLSQGAELSGGISGPGTLNYW